jgi:hypothetical protein
MATYKVKATRKSKAAISIPENEVDNSTALTLFGRKKLGYGEKLNQNLLQLLESFACPEVPNATPIRPDVSKTTNGQFDNPVEGQLWFNSTPTRETLYYYVGPRSGTDVLWQPIGTFGDIAANWGVIAHGAQIPLPISPSGRTYARSECSWIVSPYGYPNTIDYMVCRTDNDGVVTMQYSLVNDAEIVSGYANYLIIAIPGNVNQGTLSPVVSMTPTPTVTPTPQASLSATPTPTPTLVPATPPPTPEPTPPPSATPTPGVSATPTPAPSVTPTPPASATPTPAPSLIVTMGSSNLDMYAGNAGICRGFCGSGQGFAPGTNDISQHIYFKVSGGVGPYSIKIDSFTLDPNSTNTMTGEYIGAMGNFSSDVSLGGSPLTTATWTWTGGTDGQGWIRASAVGQCKYNERDISLNAVLRVSDSAGNVQNVPVTINIQRQALGGDGSCGGTGDGGDTGCVTVDSMIYGSGVARDVMVGDTMTVIDPYSFELGEGKVSHAEVELQPCVRITTSTGVTLECSTTAPIALADGSQCLAPDLKGKLVSVMEDGIVSAEEVVSVEDIGEKEVVHITCENNFFLAGADEGKYFLHHNVKYVP